jgi:hypothetical protein
MYFKLYYTDGCFKLCVIREIKKYYFNLNNNDFLHFKKTKNKQLFL